MNTSEPINRYRPIRTQDGEGGWIETLAPAYGFFGTVKVHENRTVLFADRFEDVIVGDYLGIADDNGSEAHYRVTMRARLLGSPRVELTIERTERPISPATIFLISLSGYRLVSAIGNALCAEV